MGVRKSSKFPQRWELGGGNVVLIDKNTDDLSFCDEPGMIANPRVHGPTRGSLLVLKMKKMK